MVRTLEREFVTITRNRGTPCRATQGSTGPLRRQRKHGKSMGKAFVMVFHGKGQARQGKLLSRFRIGHFH